MSDYDAVFSQGSNEPEKFWGEAAKGIHWYRKYDKDLESSNPLFYRWFQGGRMNRGEQTATIYDSPGSRTITKTPCSDLQKKISYFAGDLQSLGVYVTGRMDNVINIAGPRLSTGAMKEVIANHPDIAECAVIGTEDKLKDQLPVGFFVLKAGVTRDVREIQEELVGMVREAIGPIACFRDSSVVPRLPKTRSGKILRGTMRSIAPGNSCNMPSTMDDTAVLDEITQTLTDMGYPKR